VKKFIINKLNGDRLKEESIPIKAKKMISVNIFFFNLIQF